jgi:hypothetical protein
MRLIQIATLVALVASSSAAVLPRGDATHQDSISKSVSLTYNHQHGRSHTHFDDKIRPQAPDLGKNLKNFGEDVKENVEDLNQRLKDVAQVLHDAANVLITVGGGVLLPSLLA